MDRSAPGLLKTEEFLAMVAYSRVLKVVNHVITWLRKMFKNLRKFWTSERETETTGTSFMYLSKFDKVFSSSLTCFISLFTYVFAKNW